MRRPCMAFAFLVGAAPLPAQETPIWTLDREVVIGRAEHGRSILAGFGSLVVEPGTGDVYVPQPAGILVFDRNGAYLRTLERRVGAHPPIGTTVHLGWVDGRLALTDVTGLRVSYYTPEGELVETRQLGTGPRAGDRPPLLPVAAAPGGSVVVLDPPGAESGGETLERLVSLTPAGDALLLEQLDNEGRYLRIEDSLVPQPLPWHSHFAVNPGGTEIVAVHQREPGAGGQATFDVRRIGTDGTVVFSRSYQYSPRPVDGAAIVEALLAWRATLRTPELPGVTLNLLRQRLRVPRFEPAVTDVVLGTDGTVWLRREEHEREPERAWRRPNPIERAPVWWEVLGPDGERIGRVELPASTRIVHVDGDEVWGMERDERRDVLGVRFRVRRSLESAAADGTGAGEYRPSYQDITRSAEGEPGLS